MSHVLILLLTISASVASGLIGGVFFIFSVTIMRALSQLPAANGIAAMQQINRVILRSVFIPAFLGTALVSVVLAIFAVVNWPAHGAPWLLAGSVAYLVGSLLLTVTRNVPLNNELNKVGPANTAGEALWTRYLAEWTMWNHIRTVACVVAAACFALALVSTEG